MNPEDRSRYSRLTLIALALAGSALLFWVLLQTLLPFWVADTAYDRIIRDFVDAGYSPLLVRGVALLVLIPFAWAVSEAVRLSVWQRISGVFTGKAGAVTRRKRLAIALITTYCALYFFALYAATRDTYFAASSGKAMKYYAITPEGVRFFDAPGADPKYGIALREVDSTVMVNLKRAELGQAPQRVMFTSVQDLQFFDPISGEPRIWYAEQPSGEIELFSAAGVHPAFGVPLKPMTADVVRRLQQRASDAVVKARDAQAEAVRLGLQEAAQRTEQGRLAKERQAAEQRRVDQGLAEARKAGQALADKERRGSYMYARSLPSKVDFVVSAATAARVPMQVFAGALAKHLVGRGKTASSVVFSPAFITEGGFDSFFAGRGESDLREMPVAAMGSRLLLARISAISVKPGTSVAGLISVSVVVAFSIISSNDGSVVDGFELKAVGAGTSEADATSNGLDRILELLGQRGY